MAYENITLDVSPEGTAVLTLNRPAPAPTPAPTPTPTPAPTPAPTPEAAELETPPVPTPASCIRIRGARTHNLQNLDLDLPRDRLIVITGLSGSGVQQAQVVMDLGNRPDGGEIGRAHV